MFEIDLSDVKPSLWNFVIIGLMATLFIVLLKTAVSSTENQFTKFLAPIVAII